jgi:hypothetical protein
VPRRFHLVSGGDRQSGAPENRGHTKGIRHVVVLCSDVVVLELDLNLTAAQVLEECRRRGLVVRSGRELAGRAGSRHWHLGMPARAGTLELNEWQGRVWVKVHPLRDGGWASTFAYELSGQGGE